MCVCVCVHERACVCIRYYIMRINNVTRKTTVGLNIKKEMIESRWSSREITFSANDTTPSAFD